MFASSFMPCAECGASVERPRLHEHRCDVARWVDFQMFGMRQEIAAFEQRMRDHLDTTVGRFELWLAARDVRHRRH